MPRFFDDYSNTYLTHDSAAGRKQQRRGWKFRENFKLHYEKHVQEWQRGPMGLAAAQQAYIRARGVDDPAVPPLPDGWKEELDEVTGISFFIDTVSGKRTWVRPGFIPPPPGQAPPPRYVPPPPPPMLPPGNTMVPPPGSVMLPPPGNAMVPPPSHLPPPPQPPGFPSYP
ncbi:hypothetical protein FisN_22Hh158 [Fistulifera solaris]|uniref:WW domain-containing protein n=1 Tax=Fistulifera solaris TaxID=1519565 RepID=A0A1Z5JQ21_FISSO|nr:hypothetical protein FisN_22Hh158 [Fistulifera solaris]|eukprot:GAX15986.1 hypothetical protein FisN_22Hh158 [Fistulifera solaris]